MADRSAYRVLARRLKELRPRDFYELLTPLASAAGDVRMLSRLVDRAEAAGASADALRLKREAMMARGAFERAAHRVVEAIGDEPDGGGDLVAMLLGSDNVLLADALLDE